MLAIGIIAELQKEDYGDVSSSVLASPAIACMTIGSVLFVLGLLGCLGALVEMYYALMLVSYSMCHLSYMVYDIKSD